MNMTVASPRIRGLVLKAQVDVISFTDAVDQVCDWAAKRESRYVTACNVHMAVTASTETDFLSVVNNADLTTPDGAPVSWMLRKRGFEKQGRVSGPDLMWALCKQAAEQGLIVYCLGSTPQTLDMLARRLLSSFPTLTLKTESPPFRELTETEDRELVDRINASGTGILFVSLGCPKQERWMAAHRGRVNAVMIGVGAAFDFHAGTVSRAPIWMQNAGLEWLHRLCSEPRRLWRRYLITNAIFVAEALRLLAFGSQGK